MMIGKQWRRLPWGVLATAGNGDEIPLLLWSIAHVSAIMVCKMVEVAAIHQKGGCRSGEYRVEVGPIQFPRLFLDLEDYSFIDFCWCGKALKGVSRIVCFKCACKRIRLLPSRNARPKLALQQQLRLSGSTNYVDVPQDSVHQPKSKGRRKVNSPPCQTGGVSRLSVNFW